MSSTRGGKAMQLTRETGEQEFQGQALTWLNEYLSSHKLVIEEATQEVIQAGSKRSDLIVWRSRSRRQALLETELKTPETPIGDAAFQRDAIEKARRLSAPFLALWNMRQLQLFKAPPFPRISLLEEDRIRDFGTLDSIRTVEDWLKPTVKKHLRKLAHELLVSLHDLVTRGAINEAIVDPTVFVEFLTYRVRELRRLIFDDFSQGLSRDRSLRSNIHAWASKQGMTGQAEQLYESLAAQLAYRIVGQTLFYFAFRRQEPTLPEIRVVARRPVAAQLRVYWDSVRAIDYEALYEPSPLEEVPLSSSSDAAIAELVRDLGKYNWNTVSLDVLGSVFEQLIPEEERVHLGQYYTKPSLVDLIVSMAVDAPESLVLDPAVGTGTFLYRLHDRLSSVSKASHGDLLQRLWGFDISAFPAELAVINLCRLDLAFTQNFPRIAVRDFFDVSVGTPIEFPPAKRMSGAAPRVEHPVPTFDAVVGNPPYIRTQQLDDLDPGYKSKLASAAAVAGVHEGAKLDAFAYFIFHSRSFLRPGGRLAFVTSAAWLTTDYGVLVKRFILSAFQPVVLLWSEVEPFFPGVEVDTVVLVLRALSDAERKKPRERVRFTTLTKPLSTLTGNSRDGDYWPRVDRLADLVENAPDGAHDGFRSFSIDGEAEFQALQLSGGLRNWARWFRISDPYRDVFGVP